MCLHMAHLWLYAMWVYVLRRTQVSRKPCACAAVDLFYDTRVGMLS